MQEALVRYGELAATLARMVELAQQRDWAPLPALQARCQGLFEELREMPLPPPSMLDEGRIVSLASRIRADQEELSALVRPQFQQLLRRMAQLHPMT